MAKKKNDYFEMLLKQAGYCVKAAELLEKMLCNFSSEEVPAIRDEIHEIEHKADKTLHKITMKLSSEFITPIDQEDILSLAKTIDDITDALDEVVLDFYMYNVEELPKGADEFSKIITRCVKKLYDAVEEFKNFKKPAKVFDLLEKVNDIEAEGDAVYKEAVHDLFVNEKDAKIIIADKEIYEDLESCCDLCETASDVIEHIIIKNT